MWQRIRTAVAGVTVCGMTSWAMAAGGPPTGFRGGWHPVVGAGAVYDLQTPNQPPMVWEIAIVGQEGDGHWLEMRMDTPEGPVVSKSLMNSEGVQRVIMKMGQQPAIEMPGMAAAAMAQVPKGDIERQQRPVNSESITTPAGTFQCDHYQVEGQDIWINASVSPYGLVKMVGPGTNIVLRKTLTGVTTQITETPQQMPGMDQLFGGGMPQVPAGLFDQQD